MSWERVGWPESARTITIESPAFETSPPRIRADAPVPPETLAQLDPIWRSGRVEPREIQVFRLDHAYLAGEGLVFDDDLNLVAGSVTQQPPHHVETAREELAAAIAAGSLLERDGPQVLCVKPGKANYGHWLVEMLPMADIARRAFPGENLTILAPDVEGGMRAVISDSLARLGVPADRIAFALARPERVRDLIVVRGLTNHGTYMSPFVVRTLDTLASGIAPLPGHERIFVRRRSFRRVWGEDAISDFLASAGYAVISPEDHSLAYQIAAFKGARQILGSVGAALTNMAFAPPGAEAAIFYPASMPDTFYWFIAQHRGLDYLEIRCEEIGPQYTHFAHDRDIMTKPETWKPLLDSGRARVARSRQPIWRRMIRRG